MPRSLPLFLLLLLAIVSCKKKDQQYPKLETPADVSGNSIVINHFPLAVGNSWTYKVTYQSRTIDIGPISTAVYTQTITHDTFVNGYHLYYLSGASYSYPEYRMDVIIPGRYYMQNATGLYQIPSIDHIDPGYMNDSIVLQLPYTPTGWNQDSIGGTMHYYKTYEGFKRVTVGAGQFDCAKINNGYSNGYGSVHFDTYRYYNNKGIIQEINNNGGWGGAPGKGPVTDLTITTLESVNF